MTFTLTHRPSPGNINTPFGPRPQPTPTSPPTHYGQDYGWGNGLTIYAARNGTVKEYGLAGAYGNRLVIDHGWADGVRWETWYCHTARIAQGITVGEWVPGGAPIATQGATGNTLGVHLHFELRRNGVAVDPARYFRISTAPAADDIKEIVMAITSAEFDRLRKEVWLESQLESRAKPGTYNSPAAFLTVAADAAGTAATRAADATRAAKEAAEDAAATRAAVTVLGKQIEVLTARLDTLATGSPAGLPEIARAVADELARRGAE